MTEETKELIEIEKKNAEISKISDVTEKNAFTEAIDKAKIQTVVKASVEDKKFEKEFTDKILDASLKLAEVEKEKAELEKQNIKYHQELLETQQELNEQLQKVNIWSNREKRREYHFNGAKPIMSFVGITEPMNLAILYILTIILIPFYLINKLVSGTVGVLIAGASDSNRPKAVKGFLFTLLAIVCTGVVALATFFILKWLNIINI